MIPGFADELTLQPAYDTLQEAVRTVDQEHAIFFEGVTWDYFAAGFSEVPGGETYQNRSVLSYQYYEPPDFSKKFDFEVRMQDLKRLRCAGFLMELATTGSTSKDLMNMLKLFDMADKHKQSWMGWQYKHSEDSKLDEIFIHNTSRTYPQVVAGYTKKFSFEVTTKGFQLIYEVSSKCRSRQIVVYFNKDFHYFKGYNMSLSPKEAAEWKGIGTNTVIEHQETAGTTITTFILEAK